MAAKDGKIGFFESKDGVRDIAKLQAFIYTILFILVSLAYVIANILNDKAIDYETMLILGSLATGNGITSVVLESGRKKNKDNVDAENKK